MVHWGQLQTESLMKAAHWNLMAGIILIVLITITYDHPGPILGILVGIGGSCSLFLIATFDETHAAWKKVIIGIIMFPLFFIALFMAIATLASDLPMFMAEIIGFIISLLIITALGEDHVVDQ